MSQSTTVASLDKVMSQALADNRIVGAVVLASLDGEPLYHRAAGWADRERKVPMRNDTIFHLSSVSKPIVTAAVMTLVEEGRIELDDPISRYLADFRPRLPDGAAPALTIRQLLTHSSGLSYRFLAPSDSDYHRLNVSDGLDQPGLGMVENLRRLSQASLIFVPGEGWCYSLGIDVLGAMIETVTGMSLAEAVRARVTGPLGMVDTDFRVTDRMRLATPYVDAAPEPRQMSDGTVLPLTLPGYEGTVRFDPSRIFHETSFPSGGGGMAGTAIDMLRFFEAVRLGGASVLKAPTVAEMMRDQVGTQTQTQGPGWGFGYGWAVLADKGQAQTPQSQGTIQWGGVYGHYWFVDPVRKLTLVSMTNTTWEGMIGAFPFALRDALYS
ncbi:serine hydrolase domain-containing protein [Mesorhizobium sp. M0006]|uniref:serine hydrolase domain-containing protein n=1 Tax=Mesorhizobium sp. M0006 TaxID=2956838 RepID=UPI00333A90DD